MYIVLRFLRCSFHDELFSGITGRNACVDTFKYSDFFSFRLCSSECGLTKVFRVI